MQQYRQPPRRGGTPPPRDDSSNWTFPLPCDVAAAATIQTCPNVGLWLEHFAGWEERRGEIKRNPATDKRERVPRTFNQGELPCLLSAYKQRWDAMLKDCEQRGYVIKKISMCADSRVIVGLGAESVLETSVRLHRIYGFPIIPGSALKGLARSYAELVEGKDENDDIFAFVFGKSPPNAAAGKVIFFDAVPANPDNLKLDLDVMNPHYGDYYRGGSTPPADYLKPTPVFFLAIAPNSEFLFAVASKEPGLAQQAKEWLWNGLTTMGVGAKTTSGYGLWR